MRKSWLLLGMSCLSIVLPAAPVVHEGAAPLQIDTRATGADAWKNIYVISIIYPQLAFSVKSGEMLANLQKEYRDRGVEVFGILPDAPETVRKFAADHPEFDFTLCADPGLKSLAAISGGTANAFSRASILNKAGKLLWSGDPIDLPMMLKRIDQKQYNERDEIRMSVLADHLQAALRSGDARMIEQSADRILEVRPEQLSAVNAKAFALENSGRHDLLEKFLQERIEQHPQWPEAYFMRLEAAYRLPALASTLPDTARRYYRNFPGDASGINAIAWSLLNNAPFNAEAFQAAADAVKLLTAMPENAQNSRVLATRALLAYRQCRLDETLRLLQTACDKATGAAEKKFLTGLLNYFQQIQR